MPEKKIAIIENIIFMNKQNISWNQVEQYLKQYVGNEYQIEETGDVIHIAGDFPNEFAESNYTKSLRGAIAKVKANAAQIVGELIVLAENKRWVENKAVKHAKDAEKGWYRYDCYFAMRVQGSDEAEERMNFYKATLVVRNALTGLFLYDIINIKKEASTPHESN